MSEPMIPKQTVEMPYERSLGPVVGKFFSGLRDRELWANKTQSGRVQLPPFEHDPLTGDEATDEWVRLPGTGSVTAWAWVDEPLRNHPLQTPFAWCLIRLDGADTDLLHAVAVSTKEQMATGMRVRVCWRAERVGQLSDIESFVPFSTDAGTTTDADEGTYGHDDVSMMHAIVSLDYERFPTLAEREYAQAIKNRVLTGHRCPECHRVYTPPRGYCPICVVATDKNDEIALADRGVVVTYTVLNPDELHDQDEVPRAHVSVRLDDTSITLMGDLLDVAADDVRIGMRLQAVWRELPDDEALTSPGDGWGITGIAGWRPSGEPDVSPEEIQSLLADAGES